MGSVREAQRRKTEARVLAAATELFRTSGFALTTVRDIANAAGVSAGTVMSVGDKDALLVASFDQRIEQVHRARAGRQVTPTDGVVEQITALIEPFAELFTADPGLARRYGSVLVTGETESDTFTELASALIGEIEIVLRGAGLPDTRPLAESIYFAYIGRLFTWPPDQDQDPNQLKRSLKHIVAAICQPEETSA